MTYQKKKKVYLTGDGGGWNRNAVFTQQKKNIDINKCWKPNGVFTKKKFSASSSKEAIYTMWLESSFSSSPSASKV